MTEQKYLSETQLRRAAATAGVIAGAGAIIGSVLTYVMIKEYIETYVAEAYEAESKKSRTLSVNIITNGEPFTPPQSYSQDEQFKSDMPEGYLASKVGFKYEVDETTRDTKNTPLPFDDQIHGTKYDFVIRDFGGIQQELSIFYFTGGVFHSSSVFIYDENGDNIPDYISLGESKADLTMTIRRNDKGILEYEFVDEKGAKELFDTYTTLYQDFKKQHTIDERIQAYQPSMVIGTL